MLTPGRYPVHKKYCLKMASMLHTIQTKMQKVAHQVKKILRFPIWKNGI